MRQLAAWGPALLLSFGALVTIGIDTQRPTPLNIPLDSAIPGVIEGYVGRDIRISDEEIRIAAPTTYLMRNYEPTGDWGESVPWFSVYIGYYAQQAQGQTIHSPKNCLPGAGWDALSSRPETIETDSGAVTVNWYHLQREGQQVLVFYWYQGRGRVQYDEYAVKWDLLWDSTLKRRSDEALVRLVVPIIANEQEAFSIGSRATAAIVPRLAMALPSR